MNSDLFSLGRLFLFILLPKKLFLKFLCMPIELNQKSAAVKLIQSYPLLQLITEMTRVTQRITMNSLLKRFDELKQTGEIRFNNDVIRQLNEFSSRKFDIAIYDISFLYSLRLGDYQKQALIGSNLNM